MAKLGYYNSFGQPDRFFTVFNPSLIAFEHVKPVCTKAFKCCDYKFKIGALRILLSENTFARHWETVVDCMENIGKCQQ